jgi:hypothetical protein
LGAPCTGKEIAEALERQQRALTIDEAVFGTDHPTVASDLNEIGVRSLRKGITARRSTTTSAHGNRCHGVRH